LKLSHADFQKVLNTAWLEKATGVTHSSRVGHRLVLDHGNIYCTACNSKELVRKSVTQHSNTASHIQSLIEATTKDAKNQVTLQQIHETAHPNRKLTDENVLYRMSMLKSAYESNMTMGTLEGIRPSIETNNKCGLTLGYAEDLPRAYATQLMQAEYERILNVLAQCFPDFGTISDGTPTFCKAEAVMLRLVNKTTWEIIEILVSVNLFDTSLTGEYQAGNLFKVLVEQCKLLMKHWRVSTIDRAATNKKCIDVVKRQTDATTTGKYCFSPPCKVADYL
jgi:hypothetical protein